MSETTLVDYQQSDWTTQTAGDEVTPTVTWLANDRIMVLGATEDNALALLDTPTATGLTFLPVAGTPTATASHGKLYAWQATAGSDGSSAITATRGDAGTKARGIAAFVFRGSDGLGNTAIATGLGATTTQSLIRGSNNSAVIQVWVDWDAVNDTTVTWTPTGETQRVEQFVTGAATFFVCSWPDQGAAGTTSYGFTAGGATAMAAITLEIKGSASIIHDFSLFPKPKLRR